MGHIGAIKWTDEVIEKTLWKVVNELKLDHFPTHSEIDSVLTSKSLSATISQRGGTVFWAEKLGLPIKNTETSFGEKFEEIAIADIKKHTGLTCVHTNSRHPYDLLVDGSVKIDVKASRPLKRKESFVEFSFNLEKKNPTCDLFIFYCVLNDGTVFKTIIVPSCALLGQTQLGVGEVSRWDDYQDEWEIISEMASFFNNYKYHPWKLRRNITRERLHGKISGIED